MKIPSSGREARSGRTSFLLLFVMAAIAGCATPAAPVKQLAVAKAALSDANAAGAGEFAPVELRGAMDKLDAAQRAMDARDYERANTLAEQAEVDARLASARARSAKAQKAADAVQENIRVLRQEIQRTNP